MFLKGKSILFLSVQTFDLEKEIKKKLEEFGAKVDYFDERPSNNNFTKGLIRLKRSLYEKKITSYYKEILRFSKNKEYHYLFVNRGEIVPEFFLKEFIKDHLKTYKIFYTWDSFTNHSHPTKILKFFDKKLTFDSEDAKKYNLELKPLFFLDKFKQISNSKTKIEFDLLFLGTAHSDRYLLTNKIVDWCRKNNMKAYTFFYLQGKIIYFFKFFFDKTFKHFDYKKISFKSLTTDEILLLYKKTNVILDINHPTQKGLTMRTFEAIGAEKKMITTNKEVEKYIFYNSNNIYVIDRDSLEIDVNFFKKPYTPIKPSTYNDLSIGGWLKSIFKEEKEQYWINKH